MYLESEVGTPEEVKTTLYAGDSFHCGPGPRSPYSTPARSPASCCGACKIRTIKYSEGLM
jgi:hypothetical protein